MDNFSDRNILIIISATIFIVFAFIFSVKSPERKVIESPILWKEDLTNISIIHEYKKAKLEHLFYI